MGTWVVIGNNIVIENVEMFGTRFPDKNGAALRLEGTDFTLRTSCLHDNENGVLSGANTARNIVIENSEFGHNGYGTGYTHNLYIGNVASLTFRYNFSHDAKVGHNLKSRARVNMIAYNRFSSLRAGEKGSTVAGQPSYEIDLPNTGTSYVIGNVIQQPSANQNPGILAYGEEGASNPGHDLSVVNNTFLNEYSSGGTFVIVGSGVTTPVLLQNNLFSGTGTLSTQASTVDKPNYRPVAPGVVNRSAYDLRPTANAMVIDAGYLPGRSAGWHGAGNHCHVPPRGVNGDPLRGRCNRHWRLRSVLIAAMRKGGRVRPLCFRSALLSATNAGFSAPTQLYKLALSRCTQIFRIYN